ncbi:hypothetical protein HYZ41_02560 [archaeon]|nr:hypothetical protein [archaeon]
MINDKIVIGQYGSWKLKNAMRFYIDLDPEATFSQMFEFGQSMADGYATINSSNPGGVVNLDAGKKTLEISYEPGDFSKNSENRIKELAEKHFGAMVIQWEKI